MAKCKACGKELTKKQIWRNKFCSNKCYNSFRKKGFIYCSICKKQITRGSKTGLCTSCSAKNRCNKKKYKKKYCEICNKELKKTQQKYCSAKCMGVKYRKNKINLGRKFTKKHKKNISKALKGKKHTKEHKENWRKSYKNYKLSEKQIKTLQTTNLGRKFSEEHKKKLRIARIKDIEKKNGQIFPNYNKKACEWFKLFDEINNTQGKYAVYGNGEFFIENLGYWVDYVNFDKKLIIEWDEENHYKNNKLIIKDIIRQEQIQKEFPNFNFVRIREKLWQ